MVERTSPVVPDSTEAACVPVATSLPAGSVIFVLTWRSAEAAPPFEKRVLTSIYAAELVSDLVVK